jgi:hypothetical protein
MVLPAAAFLGFAENISLAAAPAVTDAVIPPAGNGSPG